MTDHPEPEELVDFQEGRLSDGGAQRIRRHLVACRECARDLLEMGVFDRDAPDDPELGPSPAEMAEDWAAFQRKVTEERHGRTLAAAPSMERPGRFWLPLAASIMITVTGFGFWWAGMTQRAVIPTEARGEALHHPFAFDLVPEGEDHRRSAAGPEVEVPAGMDPLIPRLNLGDQTPYASYRTEILDAGGETVWSQADLRRQPAGQFIVLVRRSSLPAGEYRLRLIGRTAGKEAVLATYSFRLRYAPPE